MLRPRLIKLQIWSRQHPSLLFTLFLVTLTLYVVVGRLLCDLPLGSDFKVYYGATRSLWHWPLETAIIGPETQSPGPVYGNAFWLSSGYFKYAPFTLLLMTPIAALPWFYAASIEGLLIGMALAIVIDTSVRLAYRVSGVAPRGSGLAVKQALLLTILVAAHRDIYLENINLMLAAAVVTALRYSDRPALAGPLLGLVLALKPYFALLLGVLFLTGNFVTVMVGGLSVALYNLLPLVFLPLPRVLDLSRGWLAAMGEHVGAATFTAFPNLLARLVPSAFGLDFRMALLLSALAATAAICCSYLALRSSSRPPAAKTEASRVLALITLALLPSLVPVDDQQFLFAAPLIAYVYVRARSVPDARARRTWTLAATGIALLFAGNMPDLIGPWLSSQWTKYGLLGLANLGFIACAACLWRQSSVAVDDAVDRHVA